MNSFALLDSLCRCLTFSFCISLSHQVEYTNHMFFNASRFNQPLSNWNVARVANMSSMFYGASSFNQPLATWDTSHVQYFNNMFAGASSFNQPLDCWDLSNVKEIRFMFMSASKFKQSLPSWPEKLRTNRCPVKQSDILQIESLFVSPL